MKKITIAIDGYARAGKGTTAKGVAQALGYTYLDTGAMYRCATLFAVRNNLISDQATDESYANIISQITIGFDQVNGKQHTFLNGEDVENEIRDSRLSFHMKPIVTCLPLREKMIALQQTFGTQGGIVCDGRDAGTHIFPDAELKVFLTCDVDSRAERRAKQLQEEGLEVDIDKIRQEIELRDNTDYLGPDAVNKMADDAIIVDTSSLTIQEQISQVLELAKNRIDK